MTPPGTVVAAPPNTVIATLPGGTVNVPLGGGSTQTTTADPADLLLLGKKGIVSLPQQYIYILTVGGTEYYPTDGTAFFSVLNQIQANGDMIDDLIIKGHGASELIELGPGGDLLTVANGRNILISNETGLFIDATAQLNLVTDTNTDISLRGCSTGQLASDLNDALGGDPNVSGTPIPTFGIPWTYWMIGPWWTY